MKKIILCKNCNYSGKSAYPKYVRLIFYLAIAFTISFIIIPFISDSEKLEDTQPVIFYIFASVLSLSIISIFTLLVILLFGKTICPNCGATFVTISCSNCNYKGRYKTIPDKSIKIALKIGLVLFIFCIIFVITGLYLNTEFVNSPIFNILFYTFLILLPISLLSILVLIPIFHSKKQISCPVCGNLDIAKIIIVKVSLVSRIKILANIVYPWLLRLGAYLWFLIFIVFSLTVAQFLSGFISFIIGYLNTRSTTIKHYPDFSKPVKLRFEEYDKWVNETLTWLSNSNISRDLIFLIYSRIIDAYLYKLTPVLAPVFILLSLTSYLFIIREPTYTELQIAEIQMVIFRFIFGFIGGFGIGLQVKYRKAKKAILK